MKVAVLASGGKDSTYASWWALMQGWSLEAMITVKITGDDSMMFQLQNTEIAKFQAESIGVQWIEVNSSGIENDEIYELEGEIRKIQDSLVSALHQHFSIFQDKPDVLRLENLEQKF